MKYILYLFEECENVLESPVHQGEDMRNRLSVYLKPGEKDEIKAPQADSCLEISVTEERMRPESEMLLM